MHPQETEEPLLFLIRRTSRNFKRRLHCKFAQAGHDVTSEQWRILKCLRNKDGQIQQDLADAVNKDKTSITRIIDSMEKRNLVVRIHDKHDRRQNLIYLTNKGKGIIEESKQIVDNTSLEARKDIPQEELDICMEVLKKINSNFSGS